MSNSLVSIITPTYNCGRFISETILSVQAQTYTDWEMIIVDDCSTDDTRKIVESHKIKDKRIRYYINSANSGAAFSRNKALREARGRWIAFLDSDDLWMPDKLERQISFMIKNNYAFSYHEYEEIDEMSKKTGVIVKGPNHINQFQMKNFCWMGCLTVMYDKSKIGDIQIYNIQKNNDYAIWLKVIRKSDCYKLPGSLAYYRKRSGSISNHSYLALIKWHYRLFRCAEGENVIVSLINTVRNLVFGITKKIIYIEKYDV